MLLQIEYLDNLFIGERMNNLTIGVVGSISIRQLLADEVGHVSVGFAFIQLFRFLIGHKAFRRWCICFFGSRAFTTPHEIFLNPS